MRDAQPGQSSTVGSEEALVARFLAPLAEGHAGAFALTDDCATVSVPPGEELVVTTDAVAEGVHFLPDDTAEDIAWKALAVNVSDLAGKGAEPFAYLMALSFPAAPKVAWLERFRDGLQAAQQQFGLVLAGGDTDRRPGPLSITITAMGRVPEGTMVRRGTACPGDVLLVTGTLGDAALGLEMRRQPGLARNWGLTQNEAGFLLQRYVRPAPRLALRAALRSAARAAMDLSDGIAKDLSRLARASGCGAEIDVRLLPLSAASRRVIGTDPSRMQAALAGGDDYEILAAVPLENLAAYQTAAEAAGVPVTRVGAMTKGPEVAILGPDGRAMPLASPGWDHFAS
jgi:thiamine-monophosphate kinase